MNDISTQVVNGAADYAIEGGQLKAESSLEAAVLLTLFTRGPSPDGAARGWWGNALGQVYGSQLWRLEGAALTSETMRLAEDYAREALAWLLQDRLISQLDVRATVESGALVLRLTLDNTSYKLQVS